MDFLNDNTTEEPYYDDDLFQLIYDHHESSRGQKLANGARSFYAFVTPLILLLGLVGNTVSLRVFTATRLRELSATWYLAALSASDNVVLLTYVLFDWLLRGLPFWKEGYSINIIHKQGLCQTFLFLSYLSRFISVYLIVIFTVERYIAVCRPLQRRVICTKAFAQRLILGINIAGALFCLYKPLLSGMYKANTSLDMHQATNISTHTQADWFLFDEDDLVNTSDKMLLLSNDNEPSANYTESIESGGCICTWNPQYENIHFVLELVYGLSITAIPFVLVAVFNFLMLKRLVTRHCTGKRTLRSVFRKSKIRIEFTITVLAVSTCFVCLNIPYFVIWLRQNLQSFNPDSTDVVRRNSDLLVITRTIFSLNYSINFFVYCLTGSYYRGVLGNVFGFSQKKVRMQSTFSSLRKQSMTISMLTASTELQEKL